MTIKVQGETYESVEDVLATIWKLTQKMNELPESHPGRGSLALHIERLQTAAGAGKPSPPAPADGEEGPESTTAIEPAPPAPDPEDEALSEDEDEDENALPPGLKLCPICKGMGALPMEPPIDPRNEACPRCQGHGKVITGSNVSGHELLDCPDCQGQGYIARRAIYTDAGNGAQAASSPGWPGSTWNADESVWMPPPGAPPWTGAVWDALKGTYA